MRIRPAELSDAEAIMAIYNPVVETSTATFDLVPRTLEARGLDATPPLQAKFERAGDLRAVEILGVILRDEMRFKGDQETAGALEAAGAQQWRYTHNKTGKDVAMPYWTVPDAAYDDPDEMARWVRLAWEAALRAK